MTFEPEICLDCNHPAHPHRPCARDYDGGPGRHVSCRCVIQRVAADEIEEDQHVIARNLPAWHMPRLTRLVQMAQEGRDALARAIAAEEAIWGIREDAQQTLDDYAADAQEGGEYPHEILAPWIAAVDIANQIEERRAGERPPDA